MEAPSVKTIINDRGGYIAVARALGVKKTTVHTWYRKDKLPSWRRDAVIALAKVEKIDQHEAA